MRLSMINNRNCVQEYNKMVKSAQWLKDTQWLEKRATINKNSCFLPQ